MKYSIYTVFIIISFSCIPSKSYKLLGNVYTKDGKCKKWTSVYVNAMRIEEIKNDSIYVRLQLGKELFYPLSLVKSKNKASYISKKPINFYANRKTFKSSVKLTFSRNNTVFLKIKDSLGLEKTFQYIFTKKDSIDKDKIRNAYYSEDGFNLCD
jgi:hypothetical protein